VKDYQKQTIHAYDTGVDKYEAATSRMVNMVEIKQLLKLLPKTSNKILDADCAYGKETVVFKDLGYEAIGIDLSDGLVRRAKQKYPDLEFRMMDVLSLDFPDEEFAAVWSNAVLHHLRDEDVVAAFREFHRVLVSGGIVGASFKQGSGEQEMVESFSNDGARFYKYQNKNNLSRILNEAGFEIVEEHVLNERERFGKEFRDLNWLWVLARKT
jgi:SAM-dependent methyltransferase